MDTVLVKNINVYASEGSGPAELTNVNGALFFTSKFGPATGLWKSNGTELGTVNLRTSGSTLININGTLFFTLFDNSTGAELWKSDGTEVGTVLVKDMSGAETPWSRTWLQAPPVTTSGNYASEIQDRSAPGSIELGRGFRFNTANQAFRNLESLPGSNRQSSWDEHLMSDDSSQSQRRIEDLSCESADANGDDPWTASTSSTVFEGLIHWRHLLDQFFTLWAA